MKSIITDNPNCYICGDTNTEEHHVMFGTANRKISDKYGLTVRLCPLHHRGNVSPHHNRELDLILKEIAQTKFETKYSHEKWMELFGRNYL